MWLKFKKDVPCVSDDPELTHDNFVDAKLGTSTFDELNFEIDSAIIAMKFSII